MIADYILLLAVRWGEQWFSWVVPLGLSLLPSWVLEAILSSLLQIIYSLILIIINQLYLNYNFNLLGSILKAYYSVNPNVDLNFYWGLGFLLWKMMDWKRRFSGVLFGVLVEWRGLVCADVVVNIGYFEYWKWLCQSKTD